MPEATTLSACLTLALTLTLTRRPTFLLPLPPPPSLRRHPPFTPPLPLLLPQPPIGIHISSRCERVTAEPATARGRQREAACLCHAGADELSVV